jgi:hypothetical protein
MDGSTRENIGAGRSTKRAAGEKFAVEFAARLLELDADLAVLRLEAAFPHQGSSHPGDGGPGVKHVAHLDRLVEVAARRSEVDRQVAITQRAHKSLEAGGRAGFDLPFSLDPAVATAPAGIRRALDHIERHRLRSCWLGHRPPIGRSRRCRATGQHAGQGNGSHQTSTRSHARKNQREKRNRELPKANKPIARSPCGRQPKAVRAPAGFLSIFSACTDCNARIACYTAVSRLPALVRRSEP